jgi:hypothetical protein
LQNPCRLPIYVREIETNINLVGLAGYYSFAVLKDGTSVDIGLVKTIVIIINNVSTAIDSS